MIRGLSAGAASLALAVVSYGCVSALREPPTVFEIGAEDTRRPHSERGVEELMAEAGIEMAGAPDPAAVERARELYLESAGHRQAPLESFLGAARATAWLIEHENDGDRRREMAIEGVQISQLCRRAHPDEPECRYRLALAVGQQARERPSTGVDGLDVMVALLEGLIEETPSLDRAGPHRVLALVLLRAPGWPSGPGDPEFGLEHAQAAVVLAPEYAPNHLVLGEALDANGNADAARLTLESAVQLAREMQATGSREAAEWTQQGLEALKDLH